MVTQDDGNRLHTVLDRQITTSKSEETLHGDQVAAKQCYLATICTKATMKKVQLLEKEINFGSL